MSFLNSLKWSFLGELASKIVQPVVFLVLTQLLTPEDFGVMTAALITASFSQIFWEAGLGKALIQRQTDVEEAASVAFWVNLILGLFFSALLFLLSDFIGRSLFRDPRVGSVLQVMALHPLLGALASVQLARLRKAMAFRTLFWVRLATVFVPGIASVPLATLGLGYWALVLGLIAGQVAQVVVLGFVHRWRPGCKVSRRVMREMLGFGGWVSLSGLLTWIYMWADSLVLGRYLSIQELGIFRTGNQLAEIPFLFITAPLLPVLYSQLSRSAPDSEELRLSAIAVVRSLILLTIPTGLILSSSAAHLEDHFFNAEWTGVGSVVLAMSILHGFSYVVIANGEIYRAAGRPRLETIVMAASILVYIPSYIWVVQFGLEIFIWARVGLGLLVLIPHLAVLDSISKTGLFAMVIDILNVTLITLSILAFFQVSGLDEWPENLGWVIVLGAAKLAVVMGSLYALERRKMVQELWTVVRFR